MAESNVEELIFAVRDQDIQKINAILKTIKQPIRKIVVPLSDIILKQAIETKDLNIINQIISAGAIPNFNTLDQAIKTDSLPIVSRMIEIGAVPSDDSIKLAQNNQEILDYILKNAMFSISGAQNSFQKYIFNKHTYQNFNVAPKFIAAGADACIYQPILPCNKQEINIKYGNNSDYVMKLNKASNIETIIGNKLKVVDPDQKYFIYLDEAATCQPNVPNNILAKRCPSISVNEQTQINGYIMKYGGDSIYNVYEKQRNRMTMQTIIQWLNKLLKSLQLLQSQKIIHYDIHPGNILIDDSDEARLIDFGRSVIMQNIGTWYKYYKQIEKKMNGYNEILPHFHNVPIQASIPVVNSDKLIQKFHENSDEYQYEIIEKNIYKIDVFSLGHLFDFYITKLAPEWIEQANNMDSKQQTEFNYALDKLKQIINKMTAHYPEDQLTSDEALAQLQRITTFEEQKE